MDTSSCEIKTGYCVIKFHVVAIFVAIQLKESDDMNVENVYLDHFNKMRFK